MFCSNCGQRLCEGQNFCPNCGVLIRKRHPVAQFFITLLQCIGFYCIFYSVHVICSEFALTIARLSASSSSEASYAKDFYTALYGIKDLMGIVANVIIIFIFYVCYVCMRRSLVKEICFKGIRISSGAAMITMGLASQFLIILLVNIICLYFPDFASDLSQSASEAAFGNNTPILEFINIAVMTAVCEEILFRGIIHKRLTSVLPVPCAIILSSVLFGAAHLNAAQFVYTTLLGILLALVYEKYGSVLAPILIHMAFNAGALIISKISFTDAVFAVLTVAFAGLFVTAVAFVFFTKLAPKETKDNI